MDKRLALLRMENNLRGLGPEEFAAHAAEHINEVNAIHPLLDGNGRAQRAFLEALGRQTGYEIDLTRISPEAWNRVSIEGFHQQDHGAMRNIVAAAIDPGPTLNTPGTHDRPTALWRA